MVLNNLPQQPTPFIGRQAELDAILQLLTDSGCRLLTLVGSGGMGKTRLTLEVGRLMLSSPDSVFPDGVYFVPLQSVTAADFVPSVVANVLDIPFYKGGDPQEQVLCHLAPKNLLLILDNVEHLLDSVPFISDMLVRAPGVKLLATSREAFNLQEEWLYPVTGMQFPEQSDSEDCDEYSAVQLFIQHARRIRPDFDLAAEREGIIRICRLVDGMPLALELAAVWVRTLSCAEIADEIERGLDILETSTRNMPERHRNMRVMLEQSWNLLSEAEQTVFKKLSIFQGGFTRSAAETVAGATVRVLSALVNKSLLRRNAAGRYDMHELLRQYGMEKLDEASSAAARDLHSAYYADFLAQNWHTLRSSEQSSAMHIIAAEIENIRVAWLHMVNQRKYNEINQSACAIWYYHLISFREQDGLEMLTKAVAMVREADSAQKRLLGSLLIFLGSLHDERGDRPEGLSALKEGLSLLETVGSVEDHIIAYNSLAHHYIGQYGWELNEADRVAVREVVQLADSNLDRVRHYGEVWWIAECLYTRAALALVEGRFEDARQWGEEGLKMAQSSGDNGLTGLLAGPFLGRVLERLGDYTAAKEMRQYSNKLYESGGYHIEMSWNYQGLGYIAFLEKDYAKAHVYFQQSLRLFLEIRGHPERNAQLCQAMFNVGKLWAAAGQFERAVILFNAIAEQEEVMRRVKAWANEERDKLRYELTPERFTTAVAASKSLDIEALAGTYLTEESLLGALGDASAGLSEREHEILRLAADGLSNREIADKLIFSVGTVKWYMNQIYSKLGVGSRTKAIARARSLNLLD